MTAQPKLPLLSGPEYRRRRSVMPRPAHEACSGASSRGFLLSHSACRCRSTTSLREDISAWPGILRYFVRTATACRGVAAATGSYLAGRRARLHLVFNSALQQIMTTSDGAAPIASADRRIAEPGAPGKLPITALMAARRAFPDGAAGPSVFSALLESASGSTAYGAPHAAGEARLNFVPVSR